MNNMKEDITRMQQLVGEAFSATGALAALADSGSPEKLQKALEEASGTFERSALELRRLCEKHAPGAGGYGKRPVLPRMETAGFVERFGCGWLHIQLNTLLPRCRYQPSEWLSDTIRRLLDDFEASGREPPFFQRALLVIEEHCGVEGRHIFDQDNKGWKAVSNAIKGRLVPDDDQFTLALAMLSERSELNVCHIKEYELLAFLMVNPGQIFNREQLLNRVWGYDFEGTTRTVDTHVKTLRQKLGDEGRHIVTLIRSGYKFEVAV